MKTDPNVIAGMIGGLGAFLKGWKRSDKLKSIILNAVIGGVLAFLSMDLIPLFIADVSERTTMLISFSIGYVANELTDQLEDVLDVFFDSIKDKIKSFFK